MEIAQVQEVLKNIEIAQFQEILKNMSGVELAQAQNAIVMSPELEAGERSATLTLISHELAIRQNEPVLRTGERFLNRHGKRVGKRVGLIALSAILGINLSE